MLAISVRPARYSHELIEKHQEFVVNIPVASMEDLTDYVGVTTGREEDKWSAMGLTPVKAEIVKTPLIDECIVNLECRVVETVRLPSHSVFIGEVVCIHVDETLLNDRYAIDLARIDMLAYDNSAVRERPVKTVNVDALRTKVRASGD